MEDRRKLVACLELCGKSDHEITRLLDGADRKGELSDDPFVPQRIQDYMDKAKVSFLFILKISTVQTLQTYCFSPFNLHSAFCGLSSQITSIIYFTARPKSICIFTTYG